MADAQNGQKLEYFGDEDDHQDEGVSGSFGFNVGIEPPTAGGTSMCYSGDSDNDCLYSDDETGADPSPFDFSGIQNPLAPSDLGETVIALPPEFAYEDPDLDDEGAFYAWATGPPLPSVPDQGGQTIQYAGDEPEDEETGFGAFGFTVGIDAPATNQPPNDYQPDQEDDPEEFGYGTTLAFQAPSDDVGQTSSYFADQDMDDEETGFGCYGFLVGTSAAVLDQPLLLGYQPDEEDDIEEFGYGTVLAFQAPSDDIGEALTYFSDEVEEPPDEDFGFCIAPLSPQIIVDSGGESIVYCPDEGEEREDEDFGILDFQLPPDYVGPQPLGLTYCPEESEEPEDEDFGLVNFQIPSNDVGQTICYVPDQSEEPEDEDFGSTEFQLPANYAGPQPASLVYFPEEAEEPEDEDFFDAVMPLPLDDSGWWRVYLPDEAEEPEDEDFGAADFQIPPDFIPPLDCAQQYFPDEAEEPENEDYAESSAPLAPDAGNVIELSRHVWHIAKRLRAWHIDTKE